MDNLMQPFSLRVSEVIDHAARYHPNRKIISRNIEGPITEAHFVYPQSLKNTARVQAFRNFLFSKIGDWK